MTHARRGHECQLCGAIVFGNGGAVSHGRAHVRRGEAVEMYRWYDLGLATREFVRADNAERLAQLVASGFTEVPA